MGISPRLKHWNGESLYGPYKEQEFLGGMLYGQICEEVKE